MSKYRELWSTNRFKLDPNCLPALRTFCFLLHCQASQTDTSKRNSTKLCQTVTCSTKIGHMHGSNCDLKTHIQSLEYLLPVQIGGPKTTFFWTTWRLNDNFNGLYLRNDTRYRQSVKCIDNYMDLLHPLKISWTLVHKRLQPGLPFLPTLCKFCFLLHCQASQTDISKQNSGFSADLSLWLVSPIFWAPLHQNMSTYSKPFFPVLSGSDVCKLGVISRERLKLEVVTIEC